MENGKMVGIAKHPRKRIVYGGLHRMSVVILVLLGTLVLAASAHAESGSEGSPTGESSGPSAPAGPGAEEASASTPPATEEQKAEAAPTIPVVIETPEVTVTLPVETPEPSPTTPAAGETQEAKTTPASGETQEAKTTGTGGEEGAEGSQSPRAGSPAIPGTPSDTQDGLVHGEVVQEGPTAVLVATPGTSTAGGLGIGIPPTSGPGGGSPRPPAAMAAAQRVAEMSCAFSALGGRTTDNCTAGLLGAQRALSAPATNFADAPLSLAAAAGPPGGGGGHGGGTPGGSNPVSPGPGPAPGGAAGGSAAGTSGLALAGFLSLAGLLLLGAPRAMRRLRLSCEPWLTACFVLIPERPG
jgi:translation initiation factor IF-2